MSKLPITVTIITRNEASRIEDAIRSVQSFASEILVIDSESTDGTVDLATKMGAKTFVEPFRGFGQQKNRAQALAKEEWVLNIDADERVPKELEAELRARFATSQIKDIQAFSLPRKTWYLDRWVMHSGWYPNYLVRLARKNSAKWTEPNIHEALEVKGKTEFLKNPLEHFSFPDQRSHILKNIEYADRAGRDVVDRNRSRKPGFFHFVLKPIWKFFDIFFLKLGFLDGKAGFFIAIHSAYAHFLRYTYVYEQSLKNSDHR